MPKKSETDQPPPPATEGSPPKIVKALDDAFIKSQEDMPADFPAAQSGSTGVACWVSFFSSSSTRQEMKIISKQSLLCQPRSVEHITSSIMTHTNFVIFLRWGMNVLRTKYGGI
jgi:hypothetical protein